MSNSTVEQFAAESKMSVERMLEHLKKHGINKNSGSDMLTDADKAQLSAQTVGTIRINRTKVEKTTVDGVAVERRRSRKVVVPSADEQLAAAKAAQEKVLIKDATALERLRKVDAMVIDKTGTLTIPNQDIDFTKADDLPLEARESLKPNAAEAMQSLQNSGVEVYMMSGDKEEAAHYWAQKAGIEHYKSKVLPQDKEDLVRTLQQRGKTVAMVGDGINDTQALALADVSIAIGRGTDVAMDVAQVTLMSDDLRSIPKAIRLSQRTVKMIGQNLFWAFIYNIVCIPLAAGALHLFAINFQITPMWAGMLMAFSSVSVVLNSLRLRYVA